ncbi:Smr/MutS family protein [Flexibacterium corallicola]|uniref:Smr/MutS family protein n=1 Tax=Flexibacterium corallicola TaxID=3037259 RepID=UPI00286FA7C0|nr:Smr/MutS family protein [Pseudovibrio sp. M1P-2-3]
MNTSGPKKKKGKELSAEDKRLWSKVAQTLTPLHPETFSFEDIDPPSPEIQKAAVDHKAAKQPQLTSTEKNLRKSARLGTPVTAPVPPLAKMPRKTRKRVAKGGGRMIDARIDLHGLTQHQAHDRLRGFLHHSQQQGYALVLVITGKGTPTAHNAYAGERGVLRRVVPHWLSLPDFRHLIIGFEAAHTSHGGDGAIYVQIRKRRDSSRDYL